MNGLQTLLLWGKKGKIDQKRLSYLWDSCTPRIDHLHQVGRACSNKLGVHSLIVT